MGKLDLKAFIRAMKRANRKQVYGRLFIVDKATDEVCGCALGQALLDYGAVTEDEVKATLKAKGRVSTYTVYDPVTEKKEQIAAYADASWESTRFNPLLATLPTGFTEDVISNNDSSRRTIWEIVDKVITKYLPNGF